MAKSYLVAVVLKTAIISIDKVNTYYSNFKTVVVALSDKKCSL